MPIHTRLASTARAAFRWLVQHPDATQAGIVMLAVIGFYEALWYFQFFYQPITQTTLGLVILLAIATIAFRHGLRSGITVALVLNFYAFYAFSLPPRHVLPLSTLLNSEWLLAILFFGPAISIGYLRERVNELVGRERAARQMAESEQQRLTTILQQLPVGVVIAEAPSGQVIFGNQYLEQLVGHSESNSALNAQSLPLREWPLRQVIEGQSLNGEEFIYEHNGHQHVLRVSGTPIYNQNRVAAGVVIIDDITREKELEQRKDDFVSMVSHELKTPITSLKMYLQLAARQTDSTATVEQSLERAVAQTDKLTHVINDLLVSARTQPEDTQYRSEPVDLSQLAQEITHDIQASTKTHAITLKAKSPVLIHGDRDRIGQVMVNLLNNAIKYSPRADKVEVEVHATAKNAIFSVKDRGIGISMEQQQRIFERFYQINRGANDSGMGIGLYLCREIVQRHGGKIAVKSQLGQGATFTVTLPRDKSQN